MNQSRLNRAVARATGESLREVCRRGFSLVNLADVDFDPEPNRLPPQAVNWDEIDAQRVGLFSPRTRPMVPLLVEA